MQLLRQSTQTTIHLGPFISDADGKSILSTLTLTYENIYISKNGSALTNIANHASTEYDELGYYLVTLNATDTNTLGGIRLCVNAIGALPVWADYMVITQEVYDTMCGNNRFTVNLATGQTVTVTNAVSTIKDSVIDSINNNTSRIPANPAAVGSAMAIAPGQSVDSITNPVATNINLTGIPQDVWTYQNRTITGGTTDNQGSGVISWDYVVYKNSLMSEPLAGVKVWLTTDFEGTNIVTPAQYTDSFGRTNWLLDAGTYYIWRKKDGYAFDNPDVEEVS